LILIDNARYKLDDENSVVIDRTRSMTRKEKRTGMTATPMVLELETLLNDLDSYLLDNRKSKPDINYVVKHTKEGSKRRNLIVRMLLALTSFSGVRFDSKEDYTDTEDSRVKKYRELGYWLLSKWVSKEELGIVIRDYKREIALMEGMGGLSN
jgi:hypothetical protein